jgi:hypothetical protein
MEGSSLRRLLLFLTTLLALVATPAAAQTPSPAASPEADTLPGLQYVAARQYAPDPSQPVDKADEGLFILTVRIYVFDTEEHANGGWESTVESSAIESDIPTGSDKVEYEEAELENLGDRASVTTLSAETPEGDTGFFRLIFVQDGVYLYTLNAIGGSADSTMVTDEIAAYMVEQDPGEGDVTFSETGTSTGGVWDLLPAGNDTILDGIIPFADAELDLTDS